MEIWEYKTIKEEIHGFMDRSINEADFSNKLNDLGAQGWELVSCITIDQNGYSKEVVAVLKRRK